ncbi:MAG: ABC transporter permease subunit, partial [Anaerolineae bacterium]|nr:ABC transporter permease subunit [Anaerolineae bacterium]
MNPARLFFSNPVILKELRGRMRGPRAFVVLTGYLILVGGFTLLLYLGMTRVSQVSTDQIDGGEIGRVLFTGVVGIQLFLVTFIAPAFTAGAISGERERQTFDLLRTTLLPASNLVMGKLISALAYVFLLLLSGIPLLSLSFILGGTDVPDILISILVLMVMAIFLGTAGVYFSAATKRTLPASIATYGVALLVVVGLALIAQIVVALTQTLLDNADLSQDAEWVVLIVRGVFICLNPVATLQVTRDYLVAEQNPWTFTYTFSGGETATIPSPWIAFTGVYLLIFRSVLYIYHASDQQGRRLLMNATPSLNLTGVLRRWDRRRRLTLTWLWLPRALLVGALVGMLVAVISLLRPWLLPQEVQQVALVALGGAVALFLLAIWLYPRSIPWLAQHFDLRFGLKERISTALQLREGHIPSAGILEPYQIKDTQAVVGKVNLREQLPFRARALEWAAMLLALAALLLLLNADYRFAKEIEEERAVDQAIEEQIEALEQTREDILSNENLSEAEQQALTQPLDEALEALEAPNISREEAVAALQEAQQQLEALGEGLAQEELDAMQQAGNELSESGNPNAESAGEALQSGDPQAAAEALEQLGENVAEGELSQEEAEALADQLDAAANATEATN